MPSPQKTHHHLAWTLAAFVLLLAWDASGFDLLLARPWASSHGFVLRDNWLLSVVFHSGARYAAWVPALWLMAGLWKPTGLLRRLSLAQRLQWVSTTLLALLAISVLKHASHSSCPWDLAEFGGRAHWVSHWALNTFDGGNGHCFPAGHASAGFAFVSGYFVLRGDHPRQARAWLVGALAAGLVLGLAQQLRGAHFMSHTAWTAWLCWTIAWLADSAARGLRLHATPAPAGLVDAPLKATS